MYALDQLEYNKFLDILAKQCHSELGKEIALTLHPLQNKIEIDSRLNLSNEFLEIIGNFRFNFEELAEVEPLITNYKHQTYNYKELKIIVRNIKLANQLYQGLQEFPDLELITGKSQKIAVHYEEVRRFGEIFDADGVIKDTASLNLNSIRRHYRTIRKNIQGEINQKIIEYDNNNFLFDKIYTKRNERFVIPIKENAVSFISGIVHDRSASKSSIYIEPAEIVKMNNDLELNLIEEKQEIFRILTVFSEQIRDISEDIVNNTDLLAEFDLYFAIAILSKRLDSSVPNIIEKPYVKLIKARHPLLIETYKNIEKVVPFEIELGQDFRLLILSGPNTGGKTVTLKAVGLLTLIALTGIPIPAEENSEIGVFEHILSDIGDLQSLENSLSTFSSHIDKISQMLEFGNTNSMILIDEIGAATDPEQGAALAQAILEKLISLGVLGVITTHYTTLKIFAESNEFCLNAAMQFNPQKHEPTFHFKPGLPGNSFAIEVAENLGLEKTLINRAKDLTGSQNIELTQILKKMNKEKILLSKQLYQYQFKTNILNQKITEYQKRIEEQTQRKKDFRKKTLQEARDYISNIQRELNNELSEIKKSDKFTKKEKLQVLLEKTLSKSDVISKEFKEMELENKIVITKPRIGEIVWLKDIETEGEIIEITENKIKVDINGIFYSTNKENLYRTTKKEKTVNIPNKYMDLPHKEIKFELKILGYTFEEALPLIRDLLDNAELAGLNTVRIVHGKGTGALRTKVRKYLRTQKKIKEIYSPISEAGGDGVTIVKLSD